MKITNWFDITDVHKIDTPALIVYPDRVRHNIAAAKKIIGNLSRLRPHVKTHKCVQVVQMMLDAGITKFKCATIAEAEMLAMCKAPDVLLAYQPVGPKIERLLQLIRHYPDTSFTCLVDNADSAALMAMAARSRQLTLPVYIDLNVGMNRTGIDADNGALQLYQTCLTLQGIKPIGLHAYDGHADTADLSERQKQVNKIFDHINRLKKEITNAGIAMPVIVIGGSPNFGIYAQIPDVECSPGTFVYWDANYRQAYPELDFLPAALVLTRVVSLPGPGLLCLDLGHKSVAAEQPLIRRVAFINAPQLTIVSQSEEHLIVDAGIEHRYKVGDVFYGLPAHICPTVALYGSMATVEDHQVTGEWQVIARERKINF
jgi:D-serine deaminase-like pyridoxal phosphate-dependent protein